MILARRTSELFDFETDYWRTVRPKRVAQDRKTLTAIAKTKRASHPFGSKARASHNSRIAYELKFRYCRSLAIMTFSFFESETPNCSHCSYFSLETKQDVPKANCPVCGREVLDVTSSVLRISTSAALLALIPESVARECGVVPFGEDATGLILLTDLRQTAGTDNIEKLRFILNQRVTFLHADREAIMRAIERDYGK